MRLYHWQDECLNAWREAGFHGIVKAATGAGKTMLAMAAIDMFERSFPGADVRVKIIVPKIFLAVQWIKDISETLHTGRSSIGAYTGEIKEPLRKYTVYVVNSARYDISGHILSDMRARRPVFLICDECHHMGAPENAHAFDFLPYVNKRAYFSLGLSATPESDNMDRITDALGGEIYSYGVRKAARDHIVSDYEAHSVNVPFTESEAQEYAQIDERIRVIAQKLFNACPELEELYGGEFFARLGALASENSDLGGWADTYRMLTFRRKEIINLAQYRVPCACELVKAMAGSRVIIFAERIQTVDMLYSALNRLLPQKARRYHSAMDAAARRGALDAYKNGEANILICCKALDEGLNIPDTDAGVIVSATAGVRQRIQRLGRVLRMNPDVSVKNIYYLYIKDSNEDSTLLGGAQAGEDLSYEPETGRLRNAEYEPYANMVMEKFTAIYNSGLNARRLKSGSQRGKSISRAQLDELSRNISLGAIRSDYRLPLSEINAKARTADIKIKNYWIAMGLVARYVDEG